MTDHWDRLTFREKDPSKQRLSLPAQRPAEVVTCPWWRSS